MRAAGILRLVGSIFAVRAVLEVRVTTHGESREATRFFLRDHDDPFMDDSF